MTFGLTNAPTSFHEWMNQILKPLLKKSVLEFFDDILLYSGTLEDHWTHLEEVFALMEKNQMQIKVSKCTFATDRVDYLGHFISSKGVETDPHNVAAIASWPTPTTVKDLRSFLGLAGYYRKFVKGFAFISKPLTNLLKKGAFHRDAQQALEALKLALTTAPVLAVPNFNKVFVVETDASKYGIGSQMAVCICV